MKMRGGFSLRNLTFSLIVAFLVWSSSTFEPCNARRGKHWRNAATAASLSNKKTVSSHNNGGGSKPQPGNTGKNEEISLSAAKSGNAQLPNSFNVLDFGAKGDGHTDDTKISNLWSERSSLMKFMIMSSIVVFGAVMKLCL